MRVTPRPVWVHRKGKWINLQSDALFPGDIILLDRDVRKYKNPNIKRK